jgi:hypothetical protein
MSHLLYILSAMQKQFRYLVLVGLVCACGGIETSNDKQVMDFGRFTIHTPKGWTKIKAQGVDSYVGRIAIDARDTLDFDLGWYSDDLTEYQEVKLFNGKTYYLNAYDTAYSPTLFDSANKDKVIRSRIAWDTIDGRRAKILSPIKPGVGITGIYIDSLWKAGIDRDRFNLYGTNLQPANEKAVLAAIQTLRFKKVY